MDGAVFVGRNGEGGLVDHSLQDPLLHGHGVVALHLGHLRIIVGRQTQNLEPGVPAGEGDHEFFIRRENDDVIGHFPDDVAKQPGVEHDASALPDIGLQPGADAGLHVVAGQGQHVRPLQQQPLQSGDGAVGGHGAGGGIHGELQQRLFAGEFQHLDHPFFFSEKSRAYFMRTEHKLSIF